MNFNQTSISQNYWITVKGDDHDVVFVAQDADLTSKYSDIF